MSAASNVLGDESPDDISSILAQLHALLTPTEQLPQGQQPSNMLLSLPQAPSKPSASGTASAPSGASPSSGTSSVASLLSNPAVSSALSNLLGGSIGSYASSLLAPAAADVAASTAPELASTAAGIEAGNDAALSSILSSEGVTPIAAAAPASAAAPAASAAAAPASSGGLLSSLGAIAPVAAIVGASLMAPTVTGVSQANINEGKALGTATQSGLLSPAQTAAGSINPFLANGAINQPLMSGLNAEQELQGETGVGAPQAQGILNSLGYLTYAQQMAANGGWIPTPVGGASLGRGVRQS